MAQPQAVIANTIRETWFWTEILGDHAQLLHENLAPSEEQAIRWSRQFQTGFRTLGSQAAELAKSAGIRGPAGSYALTGRPEEPEPLMRLDGQELNRYAAESAQVAHRAVDLLTSLRGFKEQVLQQQLDCQIKLGFGPVLVAHMITEAEEAHRTLTRAREHAPLPPSLEALHHHLIWLPDASGHAVALHNSLDGVERPLREQAEAFSQVFNGLQIKALELYSMLRVAPRMVGALKRLNQDSMARIAAFRAFLLELREHAEGCELMGSLMPLLADHMLREELYYTEQLMDLD
jgi:hypothetical protein